MRKPNAARRRLRSCSSTATAQTRLPRQRVLHSLSWAATAKRSRPRTGSTAPGSRWWRDWAGGLSEGPAGLIADHLLANDVADYLRFRAVCAPWRRSCADPRTRGVLEDPRLFPRHWIMLPNDYEKINRRFLNTRTGQCLQVDVPELGDHDVLIRATADGLLLLRCNRRKQTEAAAIRLLNPLTRQTAELPPTTGLLDVELSCAAGLLDHGTVFLYFYGGGGPSGTGGGGPSGTIAFARPGDEHWALLDAGPAFIRDAVFFAGRFYGATARGDIVTVDMAPAGGGGPRLVVAAEGPKSFTFRPMLNDTVHLVDNGGDDLRFVHRKQRRVRGYAYVDDGDDEYVEKRMYRVYRVNLSTGKTTDRGRRDLGGRVVFIDVSRGGVSVSPRVFPFLSADTVYLGLHCSERCVGNKHIGAYHVRDGSVEPPSPGIDDCHRRGRGGVAAHPLSIADTLIAYVSSKR